MSSLFIAFVVFICCCAASAVGIILHIKLPDKHFDGDSKDLVKSVMGIIATMAALVLSLLIASSKSSYDMQATEMQQLATNIVQLDGILTLYGPEARDARVFLKRAVSAAHDRIWPPEVNQGGGLDPSASLGDVHSFYDMVERLSPANDSQRRAQAAALQVVGEVTHARMLMYVQLGGSFSWPLLVVLVSWISVLFLGFGLFARVHIISIGALTVGGLSVASAIFLILELSQPYQGLLRISDASVLHALAQMNP